MEIVIDIPKEMYERIKDGYVPLGISKYLKNGTPLPKEHGRLIDADWVKNTLDIYVLNEYNGQFIRRSDIDSIPTIIEADGGNEDEINN